MMYYILTMIYFSVTYIHSIFYASVQNAKGRAGSKTYAKDWAKQMVHVLESESCYVTQRRKMQQE